MALRELDQGMSAIQPRLTRNGLQEGAAAFRVGGETNPTALRDSDTDQVKGEREPDEIRQGQGRHETPGPSPTSKPEQRHVQPSGSEERHRPVDPWAPGMGTKADACIRRSVSGRSTWRREPSGPRWATMNRGGSKGVGLRLERAECLGNPKARVRHAERLEQGRLQVAGERLTRDSLDDVSGQIEAVIRVGGSLD